MTPLGVECRLRSALQLTLNVRDERKAALLQRSSLSTTGRNRAGPGQLYRGLAAAALVAPDWRHPLAALARSPGVAPVAVQQVQVLAQPVAFQRSSQPAAASSSASVMAARLLLPVTRFSAAL